MPSLWSRIRGVPESQAPVSKPDGTLSEVLQHYDLVEVIPNNGDPFVVVSERGVTDVNMAFREQTDMALLAELGSSSPSPFVSFTRQEYNVELAGLRGLQTYDKMRRSDGTVRGTLRMMKTPVIGARWFIQPASDSVRDKNAADFVWKCLTEYMSISFSQVIQEALLSVDFGYYMFEKVWEERVIEGQDRLVWKKLAPRHPMDVKSWKKDRHGGPNGVWMYGHKGLGDEDTKTAPAGVWTPGWGHETLNDPDVYLPIDKLLVFTFDREADNLQGMSMLRSAYKHWYYKDQLYKIDAIQKERHGIGIPIIKLPVGFSPGDKAAAEQLGRNLRTNERAHVVLPPNWEVFFAKVEGQPVNAMTSIEHHDARIRENILAPFLGDKSGATKEEDLSLFLKATRFLADMVCETFNQYAIPQLVDMNFSRVGTPKLVARRIGEQGDWRTLSFAVRNLVGAKLLTPDPALEAYMRNEFDLPMVDEKGREEMFEKNLENQIRQQEILGAAQPAPGDTKQRGADKPGLPRQTPPGGQQLPAKNAGNDTSGGK